MDVSRISPALGLAFATALLSAAAPAAESYKVDNVHSTVIFRVKHMDASYAYGRFNEMAGSFSIDEADPARTTLDFQVTADSVDTNSAKRDQHLKGPDFFNAKEFPKITFKSKDVKKVGKDAYEVVGDLTLHGVTRPVTVKVAAIGTAKRPVVMGGGYAAGFEGQFVVNRSDFGMKGMVGPIGDEVRVTVSVEGTRP